MLLEVICRLYVYYWEHYVKVSIHKLFGNFRVFSLFIKQYRNYYYTLLGHCFQTC